ncbi:MAG TPA: methyltransferase domain-containing protein [Bryobacteraceae bacterium]|nr:methyltransferase domain-containing protein [Bryobacteraceae bacterium]
MLQVAAPLVALLLGAGSLSAQTNHTKSLAPYVPSPQAIVDRMLEAAQLKQGETIFDLGCGDGRILITAAQKFRAKGVGVELSPKLARLARGMIRQNGLQNTVSVIEGNLLEADLSTADVVTLYLLTESNSKLRPNLEKYLKPGARVVSHDFEIRGWKPVRVEEVQAHRRMHRIYVYLR